MVVFIAMLSAVICCDAFDSHNYLAGWGWGIVSFYSWFKTFEKQIPEGWR